MRYDLDHIKTLLKEVKNNVVCDEQRRILLAVPERYSQPPEIRLPPGMRAVSPLDFYQDIQSIVSREIPVVYIHGIYTAPRVAYLCNHCSVGLASAMRYCMCKKYMCGKCYVERTEEIARANGAKKWKMRSKGILECFTHQKTTPFSIHQTPVLCSFCSHSSLDYPGLWRNHRLNSLNICPSCRLLPKALELEKTINQQHKSVEENKIAAVLQNQMREKALAAQRYENERKAEEAYKQEQLRQKELQEKELKTIQGFKLQITAKIKTLEEEIEWIRSQLEKKQDPVFVRILSKSRSPIQAEIRERKRVFTQAETREKDLRAAQSETGAPDYERIEVKEPKLALQPPLLLNSLTDFPVMLPVPSEIYGWVDVNMGSAADLSGFGSLLDWIPILGDEHNTNQLLYNANPDSKLHTRIGLCTTDHMGNRGYVMTNHSLKQILRSCTQYHNDYVKQKQELETDSQEVSTQQWRETVKVFYQHPLKQIIQEEGFDIDYSSQKFTY